MARQGLGPVVERIRSFVETGGDGQDSDAWLLERFHDTREEHAFAALMRRHGGMVLGVCRRVTGQAQDAEDAFQATFLLLARKSGTIRKKTSIASWLHGVAFHIASKARRAKDGQGRYQGQGFRNLLKNCLDSSRYLHIQLH